MQGEVSTIIDLHKEENTVMDLYIHKHGWIKCKEERESVQEQQDEK